MLSRTRLSTNLPLVGLAASFLELYLKAQLFPVVACCSCQESLERSMRQNGDSQERCEALLAQQKATLREIKTLVEYIARLINYLEFLLELENSTKIPVIELDSSYSLESKELQ